eukprot:GILK01012195.1.p1 GENE.GILK01012195.1~~GILK01012195.1.p1  ORF type:complete len:358 (-),score=39.73 GILK01012195.1:68-1087(-)
MSQLHVVVLLLSAVIAAAVLTCVDLFSLILGCVLGILLYRCLATQFHKLILSQPVTNATDASAVESLPATSYEFNHAVVNLTVSSSWFNLGYWKETFHFEEACQALARKLANAAALKADDVVLDVGFGCGDQDVFWLKQFHVASIYGVNISERQTTTAQHMVTAGGLDDRIHLRCGNGTELDIFRDRMKLPSVSKVLSLDSAYHYRTRELFFKQAFAALDSPGRLALTDIILTAPPRSFLGKLGLYLGCQLTSVPLDNMCDWTTYKQRLQRAGFHNINVEFVEEDVFPGFADFVDRHYAKFSALLRPYLWLKFLVTSKLLRWVSNHKVLQFIIVSADKL